MKYISLKIALLSAGFATNIIPCEIIMINDRNESHKIIHRDKEDKPHEFIIQPGEQIKFGDPHLRAKITIFDLDPQGACERVLKVKQISCGGNSDPKEIHISKAFDHTLNENLFKVEDYRCEEVSETGTPLALSKPKVGKPEGESSCGCSGE